MPYSGADDASLPSNVKKLSTNKKKQWVEVFNSAMKDGKSESDAFAMANGVIKKSTKDYVEIWDVDARQISQEQAEYSAFGAVSDSGCANCNWFVSPDSCVLVYGDISPTGKCSHWLAEPVYQAQPVPVMIVEPVAEDKELMDEYVGVKGVFEKLVNWIGFKAVWSTKYKNDLPDSAFLYIEPGGKKVDGKTEPRSLRHFPYKDAEGKIDLVHLRNAIAQIPKSDIPGDKDAIQAKAQNILAKVEGKNKKTKELPLTFTKQNDGRLRFFTTFTNAFKDREGDIFSEEAHKEYVEWVNSTKQYPDLWLWHAGKESKWGKVDWVDYADLAVCASGLVDQEKEYIVNNIEEGEPIKVSHGFFGLKEGNVITRYRTFEISPLPAPNAANTWTDFFVNQMKGDEMPFSEKRKTWLKEISGLDDTAIAAWEQSVEGVSTQLKSLGIEFKDTEENSLVAMFKSYTDVVGALTTKVDEINKAVTTIGETVVALNKSIDEHVADKMQAEIAKVPQGFKPTESKENVVEGEKQIKPPSWFDDAVFKGLTG